jgi:hypothetical protein
MLYPHRSRPILLGDTEYLQDLVTFINAPHRQLSTLYIIFFNQIDFDSPRLSQSINRAPILRKRDARVQSNDNFASVGRPPKSRTLEM